MDIKKSFTLETGREIIAKKDKNRNIEGIVNGYGLMCDEIVEELISIASGEYLNDPIWKSGNTVKIYFDIFQQWYPNITECLIINFIYMSITSTISEQSFTIATNISQSNTTESTEKRNLDFWFNLRAKIVRELMDSDDEDSESDDDLEVSNIIGKGKKRTLEKKSDLCSFLHKVCEMTDEIYNHNNVTALKRDMGKKKEQIRNSMADIGKEMNQSFRGHSRLFGANYMKVFADAYTNYMKVFADAYRSNAETPTRPIQQLTLLGKLVNHSSWTALSLRCFLRIKDNMFTQEIENNTKAVKKRSDPPYPEMKTIYDYLREYLIREEISEDIINELIVLLDNHNLTIDYMKTNFIDNENKNEE